MKNYFTKAEIILFLVSTISVVASHFVFSGDGFMTLTASLLGVLALTFNSKGNPIGQALVIVFSVLYGIISYRSKYYGEMITYLGMTMPMAAFALVTWLKNPYKGNRSEVRVSSISRKECEFMWLLTAIVTAVFYFILKALNTAQIIPSTISVTTSFLAVYLTFRRNPCFALAYAANDIVLIVLWVAASINNTENISVIVCFVAFLANDIYAYINWKRIEKRQNSNR